MIQVSILFSIAIFYALPLYSVNVTWIQPNDTIWPNEGQERSISCIWNTSIWILGGVPGLNNVIEYNIAQQTYTNHTHLPVYIFLESQGYAQIQDTLYIHLRDHAYIVSFDLKSNPFQYNNATIYKPSPNIDASCITATKDGLHLLVIGGYAGYYSGGATNAFYIFTFSQNEWKTGLSLNTARSAFTCNAHRDYVYAIGGWNPDLTSVYIGSVESIYIGAIDDMNQERWRIMGQLNVARMHAKSVVYGHYIFIIGGKYVAGLAGQTDKVEVIDTETQLIFVHSTLITPVSMATVIIDYDDRMYVFGGEYRYTEMNIVQYMDLPETFAPTSAPTAAPTHSSTSPTNAPTATPTAITVSPSAATLSPTAAVPTFSPTSAPTRNPTDSDGYTVKIMVQYTLQPVSVSIVDHIRNNESVSTDIRMVLEQQYLLKSFLYADDDDERLHYYQFQIILDADSYAHDEETNSFALLCEIQCENEFVCGTISFISTKSLFKTDSATKLNDVLDTNLNLNAIVIPEADVSESESFDYVLYGLLTFMGIITIISLIALLYNKRKGSKIDDAKWSVLFIVGLQIFDFVSDINLCSEIILKFDTFFHLNLLYISGYGSIIFVVVPYAVNIAMSLNVKQYVAGNDAAMIYVEQRSGFVTSLVVFCGSAYTVLNLTASRLFALSIFDSGLTGYDLRRLSKLKVYGSVLCENAPQLVFQVMYIAHLGGKPSPNTVLSFIGSSLSIISAVLAHVVNQKASDCVVSQYYLKMTKIAGILSDEEKKNILHNKERKSAWKKGLAEAVKIAATSIELGYVTTTSNGCVLHVVHYDFKKNLETSGFHDKIADKSHENLSKYYHKHIYDRNKNEVDILFEKHFGFASNTLQVMYLEHFGYNKSSATQTNVSRHLDAVEMQLTNNEYRHEDSLSYRVRIVNDTKRLYRDEEYDNDEIKNILLDSGFDGQIVDDTLAFLKIEQK